MDKQHQKNKAISTLRMSDIGAQIMSSMTKEEAREFLKSIGYSDDEINILADYETKEDINKNTLEGNRHTDTNRKRKRKK